MNKNYRTELISIVLPVKFVKKEWLLQSIESVIEQDYEEKELIVVNDGATEEIDDIITHYGIKKYIKNGSNKGLPFSLNRGFEIAEGTFHTWTSADNYMLPGMLIKLHDFLNSQPHIDIAYGRSAVLDSWKNKLYMPNTEDTLLQRNGWREGEIIIPKSRVYKGTIGACFLYRHYVWEKLNGYDEKLHGAEDFDFWVRAVQQFKIGILPFKEPLYVYRIHPNSMSATVNGCFSNMRTRILKREIDKNPNDSDLKKALSHLRLKIMINYFSTLLKKLTSKIMFFRKK